MCNCIHHWTDDPAVDGVHNKVPVSCKKYVASLEARLEAIGAPIVLDVGAVRKLEAPASFDEWLERVRGTLDPA